MATKAELQRKIDRAIELQRADGYTGAALDVLTSHFAPRDTTKAPTPHAEPPPVGTAVLHPAPPITSAADLVKGRIEDPDAIALYHLEHPCCEVAGCGKP